MDHDHARVTLIIIMEAPEIGSTARFGQYFKLNDCYIILLFHIHFNHFAVF